MGFAVILNENQNGTNLTQIPYIGLKSILIYRWTIQPFGVHLRAEHSDIFDIIKCYKDKRRGASASRLFVLTNKNKHAILKIEKDSTTLAQTTVAESKYFAIRA